MSNAPTSCAAAAASRPIPAAPSCVVDPRRGSTGKVHDPSRAGAPRRVKALRTFGRGSSSACRRPTRASARGHRRRNGITIQPDPATSTDQPTRPWLGRPTPSPNRHRPSPMPAPRGPVSAWLRARLTGPDIGPRPPEPEDDPLSGDDFHLALGMLYELHYRGIEGVDDRWEWDTGLLALRRNLEDRFEDGLRAAVDVPDVEAVRDGLRSLCRTTPGRKASGLLTGDDAVRRIQEQAIHLSAWQLRNDAHAWAIPRLDGRRRQPCSHSRPPRTGTVRNRTCSPSCSL
jgi:hypothetical protein